MGSEAVAEAEETAAEMEVETEGVVETVEETAARVVTASLGTMVGLEAIGLVEDSVARAEEVMGAAWVAAARAEVVRAAVATVAA